MAKTKTAGKPAPSHPKYEVMVARAIKALGTRKAQSSAAIAKYIGANFQVGEHFHKQLLVQLRKLVEAGKLTKEKASYRLGDELKKEDKKPRKRASKAKDAEEAHGSAEAKAAPKPRKVAAKATDGVARAARKATLKKRAAAKDPEAKAQGTPSKAKKATPAKKAASAKKATKPRVSGVKKAAPKAGAKAKPEGAKKAAAAKGSKKRAAKDKTPVTDAPAPAEGTGQI